MSDRDWASEQVVEAARAGDHESIIALVGGSRPHVTRFARSLCASPQDAEDAAQEALIILYRKIGTLRASGALASWMFRIVRHECLRRARALVRDQTWTSQVLGVSAEDEVLGRLEAERVAQVIGALPELQRRVLIMRDVQGLPGRTVAEALGLSLAAMKSHLHRARTAVTLGLDTGSDV